MQVLLGSNCACYITHGVTAINPENSINSRYCGFRLRPGQFRLKQPFQRSNTSRQQETKKRHAGSKRQREQGSDDDATVAAAQDAGQQLQQHIQTIISAHQQLLQRLGPGAINRDEQDKPAAASHGNPTSLQGPDHKPVYEVQLAAPTEDAKEALLLADSEHLAADASQHSAFEAGTCSQEHAAGQYAADAATAVEAALPSTDWPALAAMKHVLKPKVSFSYTLSENPGIQQQQLRSVASNLFNSLITNPSTSEVLATAYDQDVLLPAQSTFCMSDLRRIHPFIGAVQARGGASLLVIDPPWENASAKRSAAYNTLTPNHLLYLPVKQLARQDPGSLIALWMTNRPRLHKFVQQQLLPCWGLQQVATWLWLKVTDSGEPISPLDSLHRHPFEQIWLLRVQNQAAEAGRCSTGAHEQQQQLQQQQQQVVEDLGQHQQQQQQQVSMEPEAVQQLQQVGMSAAASVQWQQQQQHQGQPLVSAAGVREMTTITIPAAESAKCAVGVAAANSAASAAAVTGDDHQVVQPPDSHVVISVPGQHSRKPHLGQLLMPYVSLQSQPHQRQQQPLAEPASGGVTASGRRPTTAAAVSSSAARFEEEGQDDDLVCVELFARELFAGWMSWGNEAIKFQTMDYWVKQDTCSMHRSLSVPWHLGQQCCSQPCPCHFQPLRRWPLRAL